MSLVSNLLNNIQQQDIKSLAKAITIVENELTGFEQILEQQQNYKTPIIGITGPPGAGKSTLLNALITSLTKANKKVGIIAIDPTSPFNYGSIFSDRVRMAEHFNNNNVFIRSLATRGSLGGLSAKTIEITEVMKLFNFDYIFIETVGVGQSEIEIAGLADITVLVLVPEAGDDIQTIKSGIMEIANVFVLNKSDRPGAEIFEKNLLEIAHGKQAVIKTVASNNTGIDELLVEINKLSTTNNDKKISLYAEKAFKIIQTHKMKHINKKDLLDKLSTQINKSNFNLYTFAKQFL